MAKARGGEFAEFLRRGNAAFWKGVFKDLEAAKAEVAKVVP